MKNRSLREMNSPLGKLFMAASAKGLRYLYVNEKPSEAVPQLEGADGERQRQILDRAEQELTEYFAGERSQFSVPLDLVGTDFQQRVWQQLLKIPYGITCSYRDLAEGIQNPKAVRAVGSANGKNPVCIIVPCHRVIAADGGLGGYSGGLDIKEKLLALERGSHSPLKSLVG